ncbi:MAG: EAL domain-containing protein, partial [Pseudoxanthomonas sp.]
GGQRLHLLPYMGVAEYATASRCAVDAALLAASDLAFEAKRHNEVRPLYDQHDAASRHETQRQQMYDAAEALACLRNQRVVLYFQPIRSLADHVAGPTARASGKLHGEVLCRLRNPAGELIMPSRFLGPIEAAGRGVELDLAVLNALFQQLRAAPEALAYCERIGINLTGQSLASASFQKQLRSLLADSPLPLSRLCFEITETAAISSTAVASSLLDELRAQGCSIAIDDFGVGMQSFERLKALPLDVIKIDGSFIRNVTQHGKDYALVKASVAIAQAFGARTVAEFVEDEETVACLQELGVDFIQGYLITPPRPLTDVLAEIAPPAH